jgi:hypothetical protein
MKANDASFKCENEEDDESNRMGERENEANIRTGGDPSMCMMFLMFLMFLGNGRKKREVNKILS